MEIITRNITITEYKTSDGKIFSEAEKVKAENHQDILDGKKKICSVCHGKGLITKNYGDYGYFDKFVDEKCDNCHGKGFLELIWG